MDDALHAFAFQTGSWRVRHRKLKERLAGCINILSPVRSIYRWEGAIETADEVAAILKTTHEQSDALITRITGLHSYDVPCIVTWPIDKILGAYADWVERSTG